MTKSESGYDIAMRVDPNVSNDVCTFCRHAKFDWSMDIMRPPVCALGHAGYFRSLSNMGPIWVSDCRAGELRPELAAVDHADKSMTTHTGHKGEAMTDIGRLRELSKAADEVSDYAAYNEPRVKYRDALETAAPHLLSKIETLRAENERLQRVVTIARIASADWLHTGSISVLPRVMLDLGESLAACDQGKVTNG